MPSRSTNSALNDSIHHVWQMSSEPNFKVTIVIILITEQREEYKFNRIYEYTQNNETVILYFQVHVTYLYFALLYSNKIQIY